ncbi:MAG: hypothetical protein QW063_00875 [Candidatus Nanoarchaeia archaeon]
MSIWAVIWQNVKQWLSQWLFYKVNKIEKPKEVLVIVAKSQPKRLMNKYSRRY